MGDKKGISHSSLKSIKFLIPRKYLIFTLFIIVLFVLFSGGFGVMKLIKNTFFTSSECGDGTLSGFCSLNKPYFCSNGYLIENASSCGCYDGQTIREDLCISVYRTEPKEISMKYVLDGRTHYLDFTVYGGFINYLLGISKSIAYDEEGLPSRLDFKLKTINEEEQREMLLPLVIAIQNTASDKEEQARIAISLVQNIPYGNSGKTILVGKYRINSSRYPYEVLYDMKGICGEKTDLLAFLLKEIGYGVSFFYYPEENHEAVGISCPLKESLQESNYCFVETTAPSIITDNKIYYKNIGYLNSRPDIYLIYEGKSLGKDLQEYRDADKLIELRNSLKKDEWLKPFDKLALEKLKRKYGLSEEYYSG